MNEVILLDNFMHDVKRLLKKYRSLKSELEVFISETEKNGAQGTSLGGGLFKARLAVKSKGKGKSGGMRIISYQDIILASDNNTVFLVSIYDKSEASSVEIKQINQILKNYGL
ncbi:type II toxin-antitoxin system RelE/ParE family toxin [Mangrovibacterium marinum]|uniref:RelE toxin of RelEB toxin-antitoxin system n=1 Tax=Mangrovibacterium marinum TaxID=1639118 RepID=A0A2T5BTT9_9BACT|nr:type II toxin-antitoxin system RelE/ParE family toxin [Mangrovibacterium marinum]PTN02889.1 RelE toxin of RelEB toxin-antitoxin system [Mangrovibacterium marinum]